MATGTQNYHNLPIGYFDHCQICQSKNLQQVVNLGFAAPCDSLLTSAMLKQSEKSYPLNLVRCRECGLVQLDYAVDGRELFYPDYPYRSGITETLKKNLHGLSSHVCKKLALRSGALVVDIGSNDGTILEGFKLHGMKVLGVEPTKIANIAIKNGIETVNEFFSLEVSRRIVSQHGHASLVTAANVFAHVAELGNLMEGIDCLLQEGAVFISESHYQLNILDTLQYDSIYHEHLRFYLLRPLRILFDNYGFSLTDVERIPNYGGSIRVYATKGRNLPFSENVRLLLGEEEKLRAYEDATYEDFRRRVESSRSKIRSLLVRLHDEGKTVVGVGCPGRSATLLSYCGITTDLMPYIAEQSTSLKLGMYTPGTHIPVVDEARMMTEQPDYAMILSWHYAMPIIKSLKAKGLRSKIIIPLPDIQVID
jgi:hypothetical protein